MPENAASVGSVHILDIGLHPGFLQQVSREAELLDPGIIRAIFKPRPVFAHKGNFGHALLVAGSFGKMGAAVLGARACLRSGAGLLSCHVPGCGYAILQTTIPEAMVFVDVDERIHTAFEGDPSVYSAVGVGPGIGTEGRTVEFLRELLGRSSKPMVVDADALNIIASSADLWDRVPPYSILTPHPKEFERLFGPSGDDYARVEKAREQARERQCIIVLKGHYTYIAMPGGKGYFNSTGNPGMAKGGSGDVLTGILTGMLSQGYSPGEAALLGVYLHGLAGDLAAATWSQESMLASDLVEHLGSAFDQLFKAG
jgi:NAD(P)H-hydrate epimerase